MGLDPLNLTGTWHGTFTYPSNAGPATPFLATIEELSGHFQGTIIEPDAIYGQGTIHAALSGHRAGAAVDFVKTYTAAPLGYENPIDYVGQVSADGLRVKGVWSLLDFDGSFEMERDKITEAGAETTERVSEPIVL
ncbi:MAG: hypothetical protein ACK4NZ_03095 [Tsuneonella sp.]